MSRLPWGLGAGVLGWVLVLQACSKENHVEQTQNYGVDCTGSVEANPSCASGTVCIFGHCRVPCAADADCSSVGPNARCLDTSEAYDVCQLSDEVRCEDTGITCPSGLECSPRGCTLPEPDAGTGGTGGAGGAGGAGGNGGSESGGASGSGGSGGTAPGCGMTEYPTACEGCIDAFSNCCDSQRLCSGDSSCTAAIACRAACEAGNEGCLAHCGVNGSTAYSILIGTCLHSTCRNACTGAALDVTVNVSGLAGSMSVTAGASKVATADGPLTFTGAAMPNESYVVGLGANPANACLARGAVGIADSAPVVSLTCGQTWTPLALGGLDVTLRSLSLPDGGVIALNTGHLVALDATGALRPGFATGGVLLVDQAVDVARRADGGLYVLFSSGSGPPQIKLFDANGALVTAFGNSGSAPAELYPGLGSTNGRVLTADGDDLLVGVDGSDGANQHVAIVRLLATGARDTAFGSGGTLELAAPSPEPLRALARQGAQYLVAIENGASNRPIERFNANGSRDTGWHLSVQDVFETVNDLEVVSDGVVAVGQAARWTGSDNEGYETTLLVKLGNDGTVARQQTTARFLTSSGRLTHDAQGRWVVSGRATDGGLYVSRFAADLTRDATFGLGGAAHVGLVAAGDTLWSTHWLAIFPDRPKVGIAAVVGGGTAFGVVEAGE